jgi:hypothetical protein
MPAYVGRGRKEVVSVGSAELPDLGHEREAEMTIGQFGRVDGQVSLAPDPAAHAVVGSPLCRPAASRTLKGSRVLPDARAPGNTLLSFGSDSGDWAEEVSELLVAAGDAADKQLTVQVQSVRRPVGARV